MWSTPSHAWKNSSYTVKAEKNNNNEKDPAINFCSYHPVFVPSPLFLPCFPVTPPMHLSTLLQYFPVCVCGGKYFRPGLWGPSPSEWHWMPGRSKVGEDSLRTYGAVSWLAKCHADTCGETCDAVGSRVWECLFVPSDNSLCYSVHFPPFLFFFLL